MKRAIYFAILLNIIDQSLKYFFQAFAGGKVFLLDGKLGFTFVVNPGIYLNQNISGISIYIFQVIEVTALLIIFLFFRAIKVKFNTGIFLDTSFGFFATGLLGNLVIDRILFGGIRDYFITPFGVANFADISGILGISLLLAELLRIRLAIYRMKVSD